VKPQCAQVVENLLGRKPTKGELDSIETRIFSSMQELQAKDPGRWRQLSRDQRLEEGARLASQKTKDDITRAHANTLRDMEIKADQLRRLQDRENNLSYVAVAREARNLRGEGAQALRFERHEVAPLTCIWYAKAAFKHMVYNNLMDNLSPGCTHRVQRRMAERNQTTWLGPTDALPSRAPDVTPAFGGP